ncbi:MAG: AAA family ATPase, partial [Spirochaetales bacterium]|nr:AAA family ATPase [Spirochaetales bacterium]
VGVGKSDFERLREAGDYYVDKTELMYELVEEQGNEVTLFTRPRRFGKTLAMSMIDNFFNIRKASRAIFDGLAIMRHEDFCQEWMNSRPVIFISLKDVEGESFEDAFRMLETVISDRCKDLVPVFDKAELDEDDRHAFAKLKSKTAELNEVKASLKTLMRMLNAVYGRKVILLIDEYDVPLAKASEKDTAENRFYTQMLDVIRGLMSSSLKDNEFLEFAVVTGCLRISKESIFTGTNNFASYSVLDDRFSECFGFTESEVDAMLVAADRKAAAPVIKEWYDGYVFGTSHVYCPWDVINYMSALAKRPDARPKAFWKDSSHNGVLRTFVGRTDFNIKGKFEALMNGGTVTQVITDMLTYDTLHAPEDNRWSVLLMTGYVTKADPDSDEDNVELRIPNKEVATIFRDAVVSLFRDTIDNAKQKAMMDALWCGDVDAASKSVSDLLWKTISYNDYHEDYYHAFLAGIFTGLGYEVESNKEKGLGRPDILLKDDDNRRAIIIEAKKSASRADMEADCGRALEQIDTKKYAEGLYGYTQVLCYGIAFFQKEALVRKG